jgi:hypothetical protein
MDIARSVSNIHRCCCMYHAYYQSLRRLIIAAGFTSSTSSHEQAQSHFGPPRGQGITFFGNPTEVERRIRTPRRRSPHAGPVMPVFVRPNAAAKNADAKRIISSVGG